MKSIARLACLLIICYAVNLAAGCSDGGDARRPDVLDGERKPDPNFSTTLAIKDATDQFRDTFAPGEQIVFEVSITNLRDQALTVTRLTGQTVDFFVAPAGTREILWWASTGLAFTQAIEVDDFAAGETMTFGAQWQQDRDDGLPLQPGDYVARGMFMSAEFVTGMDRSFTQSEFATVLLPFTIQ